MWVLLFKCVMRSSDPACRRAPAVTHSQKHPDSNSFPIFFIHINLRMKIESSCIKLTRTENKPLGQGTPELQSYASLKEKLLRSQEHEGQPQSTLSCQLLEVAKSCDGLSDRFLYATGETSRRERSELPG